jgi:hypothetical protein
MGVAPHVDKKQVEAGAASPVDWKLIEAAVK